MRHSSDEANEILMQCIDQLSNNSLDRQGLLVAQTICFLHKTDEVCREAIEEYTELADLKTGGAFSEALQSWTPTVH